MLTRKILLPTIRFDKGLCRALWLGGFLLLGFRGISSSVELGTGRATGMGQAFSAINGDLGAVYYNPSGIGGCDVPELTFNVSSFYRANQLGSLSGMVFVWPWANLDAKRLGVHWNNWQLGQETIQQTGVTLAKNTMFKKFPLRLGSSLKWRSNSDKKMQSFLLDMGIQSDIVAQKVSVGMALKNLMSSDKTLAETFSSWGVMYRSPYASLTGDFSWHVSRFYLSLGAERDIFEGLLVARAGLYSAPESYFSCGLSSNLWPVAVDVSFSWPVYSTEGSGVFQCGARYRFGGKHFSEMYLERSIEKSVALQYEMKRLEQKKIKLAKEVVQLEEFKKNPDANILSLPGVAAEYEKKALPEKPKEEKREVVVKKEVAKKKEIVWPQQHRVVPNDTLRSIAQKYYDDPNKWQFIFNVNKDKIERGQPRVGEQLVIPKP